MFNKVNAFQNYWWWQNGGKFQIDGVHLCCSGVNIDRKICVEYGRSNQAWKCLQNAENPVCCQFEI